jgi:hypothetical protein
MKVGATLGFLLSLFRRVSMYVSLVPQRRMLNIEPTSKERD